MPPDGVRAQEDATPTPEVTAPPPTPTRRPTRTPRATPLPTETPRPTGSLRVVSGSVPPHPAVGEAVRWTVALENLAPDASGELLLQVELPSVLVVEGVEASGGQIAREGRIVRWYLPGLAPGAGAELRADGVAGRATAAGAPDRGCTLLPSRGAPIEHCTPFEVAETRARAGPPPDEGPALPTAPIGLGLRDAVPAPRAALGLGTLIVGLGALGAWVGALIRAAGRTAAAGSPPHEDG